MIDNCKPMAGLSMKPLGWFLTTLTILSYTVTYSESYEIKENFTSPTVQVWNNNVPVAISGFLGNDSGNYELHVLGLYDADSTLEVQTSRVSVQGQTSKPVVLVLVNVGHVNWIVNVSQGLQIASVLQITNSTRSEVEVYEDPSVSISRIAIPEGQETLGDQSHLLESLSTAFGQVKSFSGTYRANTWIVTVGSQFNVEECLNSTTCWYRYDFQYGDNWNDCHGTQYVKGTSFSVGKYLGAVLCSSTRYKLFLSDSLDAMFLNIADGSGSGEDHCILIGGQEKQARLPGNGFDSPSAAGYYRSFPNEAFRKGRIGHGPRDMSEWTGKYYNTWYECQVEVPGNTRVLDLSGPTTEDPTSPPSTPAAWDDVPFKQVKFTLDRTFVVPAGVTKLDVICIGGGGGGRDGHVSDMTGGNGGNSSFGRHLEAVGGKGAKADNSGGEGGYGTVANGGRAGEGGGCSAGAGAAGQTSGEGHNGLEAGSSTYPFCGGGGSSGGSSCGNIFSSIAQAQSGPGGTQAQNRAAGLYGGGGGSRAGGRAGGGGGYSRATISVTPGESILVRVGKKGTPSYWAGKPANGVVVVSWGGPVEPLGSFAPIESISVQAPSTTERPSTTPETRLPTTSLPLTISPATTTNLPRKACIFGNYCSGGSRLGAICRDGVCECSGVGYNRYTCLPEVGPCRILANQPDALGVTDSNTHSCVGSSENNTYEVHVLGIYENSGSRTRISPTVVRINGTTQKPMILVVSNYEPVRWIIQGHENLDLRQVLMFSYYQEQSSVSIEGLRDPSTVSISKSRSPFGLGDDSGGGNTAGLLTLLSQRFGSVSSFTGTYKTSSWSLNLPGLPTTSLPPTNSPATTTTTNLPRKTCIFGNYCSGGSRLGAICRDGVCECSGVGYNRYTCLPEVGPCRILANQPDALGVTDSNTHSCVGSSENNTYEVHVLGIYENSGSRTRITPTVVRINGITQKPMILVVSNYEPVRWIIQGHENLDLRQVLMFSYYQEQSSVSIEGLRDPSTVSISKSRSPFGLGDDSGGGNTAGLLTLLSQRFGSVSSFTGTYKTSSWSLNLPGLPTTSLPPTNSPATTTTTNLPRKTCIFGNYCSGGSRLGAICRDGVCECSGVGYNRYTCLPEVGPCRILANQPDALGVTDSNTHSCVGSSENNTYEVHVLGIYENSGSRTRITPTVVRINGITQKPMILVVSNYEPVRWIIQGHENLDLRQVLMFSYYQEQSSVSIEGLRDPSTVSISKSRSPFGLGDDSGGGNTAGLLTLLSQRFGSVSSFTGTYKTSSWSLNLPGLPTTSLPPTNSPATTTTTNLPRKTCIFGNYCSGGSRLGAICRDGVCECSGVGYNRYTCLPEVGPCRILANQPDALGVTDSNTHSCVGSSENNTYEVHVLGIYENSGSRTRITPTVVRINGITQKPMILVVSNYEPVRWIIQGHENLDLRQVLMFSYYQEQSSVSIEGLRDPSTVSISKSRSPFGLGDDSGGGNTAGLLTLLSQRFGSVSSFTGTYKTSSWSLNLPGLPTTSLPPTNSPATTTTTNLPRKTCIFGNYCSGGSRLGAICRDGVCECSGVGYNRYTCLPEVGSCRILSNPADTVGVPSVSGSTSVFGCLGSSQNSTYEVHVIGMYENSGSRSTVENTTVTINGLTAKPMMLVLVTYEPVRWIIQTNQELREVLLISYNLDRVSVVINGMSEPGNTRVNRTGIRFYGYGDDSGGGHTAGLMSLLTAQYGGVASFSGTYSTRAWTINLPDLSVQSRSGSQVSDNVSVESCLESANCWVENDFNYDASYSACSGRRFVRRTPFNVGRYIGVVLCSDIRYKLVMAYSLQDTFLNIGDGSGAGEDLCNLIGGDETTAVISRDFWDSPRLYGFSRAYAGSEFQKGPIGFGPKDGSNWTGKYFPTWYQCGVSIPGNSSIVCSFNGQTCQTTSALLQFDDVPFGQNKFEANGTFTVPLGVTTVDVICIGGGGGGRDNHDNSGYGGNGGNSSFGHYVWAEGGKGAQSNNSGGEGGRGMTTDGGLGGIGGSCSAGAGAAGQTSGGGGALVPGSSTNPFCGGGGSSGGSSCERHFSNIPAGLSGPGGMDPEGRSGGLYGGGGGSRAGGRAGGGGGFSSTRVNVTPGETIAIIVGEKGSPSYSWGVPANGVVVVSWGGPINPTGPFIS